VSLSRGSRLGPYQLVAEIGAGGMGHVFRALDTRLDRSVAIKVLPEQRWSDPEFRHRFQHEARAISSLSHPNLCALFDVGDEPVPYLVMELLEGETLRDKLDAGPITTRKALTWAAQIAHGLSAAHEKGLIHRDLKPENIFVTRNELVKILDFGLAKTATPSMLKTEPGIVMGTAHYMSPEQVRGTPIDHRSDLFSLGVVLFEMLSGRVPFGARSAVETMNAILVDDPPDLPNLPEHVDALVRRCLEKDPGRRFSSAHDLAFALENAAKSLGSAPEGSKTPRASRAVKREDNRARITVMVLILVSIGIIAAITRGAFDAPGHEPPTLRTLTYSGRDSAPAASPDGKLVAFVSSRDGRNRIWLKQLAGGTEAVLTTGPDDTAPRFSPDGAQLLFTRAEGGASALYRVALLGEPRKLIDNAFDGDWSPDGKRIAFVRNRGTTAGVSSIRFSTVCLASADGGAVQEIAASSDDELIAPRWSPDGQSIAITQQPHGTAGGAVLLVDLPSGNRKLLQRKEPHGILSATAWTGDGNAVLYAALDEIHASVRRRRGSGAAIIRHDVRDGTSRILLRYPHAAADTLDLLGDGRIVFVEDITRQNLQEISLRGGAARWLSHGMSMDRQPTYARGGTSVIFTSDRGGNVDLWELTLNSGALHRLTDHPDVDWDPHPSADATTLYWSSNRGGPFEIWAATIDGANAQQLTHDGVDAENPSTPALGDWIYYDSSNPKTDGLWRIPHTGGAPSLIVAAETIHPEVSADGQYVAYQRPEREGTIALDVVRVADHQVFTLASGIGGSVVALRVRWIGTSHTLAFRALDAQGRVAIFAQDFVPGTDTTSTRRQLVSGDVTPETFAISPDGTHVILSVVDEASELMVGEGVR
jgi:serine/threonine protein kinase